MTAGAHLGNASSAMTAPLIGLIGKKRSGKDTFAAALVERHGFERVAFADPLKATMLDLDPFVRVEADETGPLAPEITALHWEFPLQPRLAYLVERVGWERAKEVREVRRLLQAHGVAIREHVGADIWVEAAMRRVADVQGPWHLGGTYLDGEEGPVESLEGMPVVVTDVRFPNEADAIEAAGGVLVRIIRPGLTDADQHVSETALDYRPVSWTVWNTGDVADLHRHASVTVDLLFSPK